MFRDYMQKLSNEQLKNAFEELQDLQDTGNLKSGVVRGLIGVYKDYDPTSEASISIIEKEVYYEMSMRFYGEMIG